VIEGLDHDLQLAVAVAPRIWQGDVVEQRSVGPQDDFDHPPSGVVGKMTWAE
jgi:hypothetical protein